MEIPYYHFVYTGDIYRDLYRKNAKYFQDGTRIKEFFARNTVKQFNDYEVKYAFSKAFMVIVHYFPDDTARDLDNYAYKPVIDSIRMTKIIEDDNWQNLSLFTLGDRAEKEKLELFIVPFRYTVEFLFKILPDKFQVDSKDMIKIMLNRY
jgi:hypothetical protein